MELMEWCEGRWPGIRDFFMRVTAREATFAEIINWNAVMISDIEGVSELYEKFGADFWSPNELAMLAVIGIEPETTAEEARKQSLLIQLSLHEAFHSTVGDA
jgi:hypothetical protein